MIAKGLLAAVLAVAAGPSATIDCTAWTLDGYRIGMGRDEILAVRSITLHMEGQAQVVEPGRFSGVLVLDPTIGLAKWDVRYKTTDGEALRAELRERFGGPASDVTGDLPGDPSDPVRQRRTIWWSAPCDLAIIVSENAGAGGGGGAFGPRDAGARVEAAPGADPVQVVVRLTDRSFTAPLRRDLRTGAFLVCFALQLTLRGPA